MALYGWTPELVWELGLFEAVDYLREGLRKIALTAQLNAASIMLPLMPEEARTRMTDFIRSLEPEPESRALTDEFGPAHAAEVETSRSRAWKRIREIVKRRSSK